MQTEKKIRFCNQRSELEKLFSLIQELKEELTLSEEQVFSLNLAMEEALTNVIDYAYPSSEGSIELTACLQGDNLVFSIADQGIAFNPLTEAPEADIVSDAENRQIGGLGVFLFCQLMDSVNYVRQDETNILQLIKKIK